MCLGLHSVECLYEQWIMNWERRQESVRSVISNLSRMYWSKPREPELIWACLCRHSNRVPLKYKPQVSPLEPTLSVSAVNGSFRIYEERFPKALRTVRSVSHTFYIRIIPNAFSLVWVSDWTSFSNNLKPQMTGSDQNNKKTTRIMLARNAWRFWKTVTDARDREGTILKMILKTQCVRPLTELN